MKGFTLLELLIVLTIVSVLTLSALPQYREYKSRALDSRAMSDLRNLVLAEEAYYLDHERYLACNGEACLELPGIAALSQGVTLEANQDQDGEIEARSFHKNGSGKEYIWDSLSSQIRAQMR